MPDRFEYEERRDCVCGSPLSDRGRTLHKDSDWGTVSFIHCPQCGSWCQSPQLSPESLARWFNSSEYQGSPSRAGSIYVHYLSDEAARLVEAEGRYSRDLKSELPPGARVLELGCATGSLLSVLRRHGCETSGLDLSSRFAEAAKRLHNQEVLVGGLEKAPWPKGYFDAILLFGTIVNIRDLDRHLKAFRELLKPGGLLIFNHPDADAPIFKYLYRSRSWMFAPSVNCFLSRRGCAAALKRAGFVLTDTRRDLQRPSLQKLLNHAGLGALLKPLKTLEKTALPIALPIPGVRLVKARALPL